MTDKKTSISDHSGGLNRQKTPIIVHLFRSRCFFLFGYLYASSQGAISATGMLILIAIISVQVPNLYISWWMLALMTTITFFGGYAFALNRYINTRDKEWKEHQ